MLEDAEFRVCHIFEVFRNSETWSGLEVCLVRSRGRIDVVVERGLLAELLHGADADRGDGPVASEVSAPVGPKHDMPNVRQIEDIVQQVLQLP